MTAVLLPVRNYNETNCTWFAVQQYSPHHLLRAFKREKHDNRHYNETVILICKKKLIKKWRTGNHQHFFKHLHCLPNVKVICIKHNWKKITFHLQIPFTTGLQTTTGYFYSSAKKNKLPITALDCCSYSAERKEQNSWNTFSRYLQVCRFGEPFTDLLW